MSRPLSLPGVAVSLALLASGCADNAMVLKGQVQHLQQQNLALSRQAQELQARANDLDQLNQAKEVQVAQFRQQAEAAEQQVAAIKEQLASVTKQLAKVRAAKEETESRAQALHASMRSRGGVRIQPNNSLHAGLPTIDLPGVHVRPDGDVIRVELPGETLFPDPSGRLSPEGQRVVLAVASVVSRDFAGHRIGVEGHTSTDPLPNKLWLSHHHLSYAEAMAVFDLLKARSTLKAGQLSVTGHGSNYPVVSNGSPEGRRRNHRVELVVYPDKVAAIGPTR